MNPQPQGQAGQGHHPPPIRLLQPEHMRNLNYLTPDDKAKYEEGLKLLYAKMEQYGPETVEHQSAKQKVTDFSRMVFTKIKSIQARNQAASQAQAGQPGQPVQSGHPNVQPQGAQNGQYQNALAAAQAAQKPGMQPNRPPGPGTSAGAANPGAPASGTGPTTGSNPQPVSKPILDHVNKLPWSILPIPSQLPQDQAQKWLAETKNRFIRNLTQMESLKLRSARLDALVKDRQEKGQSLPPEELKKIQDQKIQDQRSYQDAERFIKGVRAQMHAAGQNGSSQGPNAQQARPQPMPPPQNLASTASSHPMQAASASVTAAMDAAKTQQAAAAARVTAPGPTGQPQSQTQIQHPGTPATPATPMSAQQQHNQQQPQPQPPQTHPTPAPQPQIKSEPGTHPPPVNTALATAASSAHLPASVGTPTQPSARVQTPQSASQQAPGSRVQPLSHAAAVNRANSSANISGQPSNSSGGITPTPGSGNLVGSASHSGHTHAHPQPNPPPALTTKMPINKNLPAKSTETPQPTSVGGGNTPGRPSMSGGGATGGGVMGQTVIPKMTIPQYDTEGDHVLSKKKLDELVRQICGGGSPGTDGNYLTPDVEESVLSVADNFVDNVLHTACRLAKERGSKVLEIRDIQLVLERVYNIRIPGYTSDELRIVRKVQPAANWISKVHAVQAAKVMPGKDDK
ncbi:hypothetical protein GGS23DRAFT_508270 [Durotheca rogersii]|uniref:uncharacterized protein n=1 Tax=Durotheca rogersii TaxID=419775 RepID=UPI002220A0D3|nr:uncharacterized protein GGS23DRAFT_508270 [Durotheca rogersii]KAI5863642.1 hypothetical protein GGS23DRAFT_508270 [Durotheca rogersii]